MVVRLIPSSLAAAAAAILSASLPASRLGALGFAVVPLTRRSLTVPRPLRSSPWPEADDFTVSEPASSSPPIVFDDVCETAGVTLTRFLSEVALLNPGLSELTALLSGVHTATKAISNLVRRHPLPSDDVLGTVNKGDGGRGLDALSAELLRRALRFTGRLGILDGADASEYGGDDEDEDAADLLFDETSRYVALFEPLDGSAEGAPVGTTFGIFEHADTCSVSGPDDCLAETIRSGANLVCSGYSLYSSSTFFVLTLGNGVYGFTLDENIGEYILSHPDLKIPTRSTTYSFDESRWDQWEDPVRETVRGWRNGTGRSKRTFRSRYGGALVEDVHRTLLYGGVFGRPIAHGGGAMGGETGGLRLLYEGEPMAFLVEQAGGMATTGRERVVDVEPEVVHQRVPVIMGSADDVREIVDAYTMWDATRSA